MEDQDSYDLIRYIRESEQKWYKKNGYDGAFWRVNIEVNELDHACENVLKRIIDEGRR